MAREPKGGRYTVTGPGQEGVSYGEAGPALSRALTEALKRDAPVDGTWYVRDVDGTCVGRVENVEGIGTRVWAPRFK